MKIIEGLKEIKLLQKKAEDLREKIRDHSAILSTEKPVYENQKDIINGWLQSHHDILERILSLRIRIQDTNLKTPVTIELDGKAVTKSIAEWVHRRRDLALLENDAWRMLTDRNLREGIISQTDGQKIKIEIVRYFDPMQRDNMKNLYSSEPTMIDSKLEVINAITDLIE